MKASSNLGGLAHTPRGSDASVDQASTQFPYTRAASGLVGSPSDTDNGDIAALDSFSLSRLLLPLIQVEELSLDHFWFEDFDGHEQTPFANPHDYKDGLSFFFPSIPANENTHENDEGSKPDFSLFRRQAG